MTVTDLASTANCLAELKHLNFATWSDFLHHSDVRRWPSLYDTFAEFQLLYLERGVLV